MKNLLLVILSFAAVSCNHNPVNAIQPLEGTFKLVNISCGYVGNRDTTKKAHKESETIIIKGDKITFKFKSPTCSFSRTANFKYDNTYGWLTLTNIENSNQMGGCYYTPSMYEFGGKEKIEYYPISVADGGFVNKEVHEATFFANGKGIFKPNKYTIHNKKNTTCSSYYEKE